jgi:hypothetical protein
MEETIWEARLNIIMKHTNSLGLCMDWFQLTEDRFLCLAVVNTVIKFQIL